MTPRTRYLTRRIKELSSILNCSPEGYALQSPDDSVMQYAHQLLEMEDLLVSNEISQTECGRAKLLRDQYPFDWLLIRRSLHELETTRRSWPNYSQRHRRSRSSALEATDGGPSSSGLASENHTGSIDETEDDGPIVISVSVKRGEKEGGTVTSEDPTVSFGEIEGSAVSAAIMAVQYYMKSAGIESAPRTFTLAVLPNPEERTLTTYERRWVL